MDRLDSRFVGGLFTCIAIIMLLSSTLLPNRANSVPLVIPFEDDDAEIQAAMVEARLTVDEFCCALEAGSEAGHDFAVKVGFGDSGEREFFWIQPVYLRDGNFHGRIANLPMKVHTVEYGQSVQVAKSDIADWMYISNGKLIGGYTQRVMRNRLSPDQQRQLDQSAPFRF